MLLLVNKVDSTWEELFHPQITHSMKRHAAFTLSVFGMAFVLLAPQPNLGQTQPVAVIVAVPASFRSFHLTGTGICKVPRGFQIRVVSQIPAARFLAGRRRFGFIDRLG